MNVENNTQSEIGGKLRLSIPLTITSRGIGFSVVQFIKYNQRFLKNIPEDVIYKLYRVSLGVFERKLRLVPNPIAIKLRYKEEYEIPYCTIIEYGFLPKSILNIINAIGLLKCGDREYHPVVAAPVYYDNGKLMPRSENVLLSTLRQTVQALADPDTPEHDRKRFKDTCPIPGTIWNEDNTLNNPDEIIPNDYKCETHFQKDMSEVITYSITFCDEMININNGVNTSTDAGKMSMLLSNVLFEMRVSARHVGEPLEDYSNRCRVEGDMSGYFTSPERLNMSQHVYGLLQLFGEVPSDYQKYYPQVYNSREQVCHSYGVRIDTQYENLYGYWKRYV